MKAVIQKYDKLMILTIASRMKGKTHLLHSFGNLAEDLQVALMGTGSTANVFHILTNKAFGKSRNIKVPSITFILKSITPENFSPNFPIDPANLSEETTISHGLLIPAWLSRAASRDKLESATDYFISALTSVYEKVIA